MGTTQQLESTSTLFGGNVPFIEEQYEHYLANPDSVAQDWRAYFDSLRGGAADVAHAPVIESFVRLGKSRKVVGAMVDAATMHQQVVVPGAEVLTLPESGRLRVGGGLQPDGEHLVASKAGVLRATKAGKLWVEGRQKR